MALPIRNKVKKPNLDTDNIVLTQLQAFGIFIATLAVIAIICISIKADNNQEKRDLQQIITALQSPKKVTCIITKNDIPVRYRNCKMINDQVAAIN